MVLSRSARPLITRRRIVPASPGTTPRSSPALPPRTGWPLSALPRAPPISLSCSPVWCLFLARHAGQRDLTVGTPISGRTRPDTDALIGFFVNTLALRVRVDPGAGFAALVAQVRQVVLDAFAHQDIPFEHVVRAVAPQRTAARNPLFTTSFAHDLAASSPARTLPGGLTLTPRAAGDGGSHFDLSLSTARVPDGLLLRLDYSTDLYDPATITGYLASLTDLLDGLASRPGAALHAFLQPTPRETALLRAWNDASAAPAAGTPLHDLIAAQAAATPHATAIEAHDTTLTYHQLDTAATALARRLRHAGTRHGDIIGIHLPPGATAITAILATWKAGAAFLPLDPDLPRPPRHHDRRRPPRPPPHHHPHQPPPPRPRPRPPGPRPPRTPPARTRPPGPRPPGPRPPRRRAGPHPARQRPWEPRRRQRQCERQQRRRLGGQS